MQFYRFEGITVDNKLIEETDSFRANREKTRKISMNTISFNRLRQDKAFSFVSAIHDYKVEIGIVVIKPVDISELAFEFLKAIDIELTETSLEEVTFNSLYGMLRRADSNDFIEDDDRILERFELDKLTRCINGIDFGENTFEDCSKQNVYAEAERFLANDTFIPELDRIYAGSARVRAGGHPVHYMIQTDDRDIRKGMYRLLLQALHANGRLRSTRYSYLDLKPGEDFSRYAYECLYKSSTGGTIIVRYLANDDTEDDHASCGRDTIETLCETMKKYCNQVLTVLCLPRECTNSKELFYENLGTISIIELKEEFVYGERAEKFLRVLARNSGIRTDKKLFSMLEEDKGYLAPDLHDIFNDWYNKKLKSSVYPQYKDIASAKREVIKAAPKGSAYDELNQMIGLDEAKKVIDQALKYQKAQMLFAEKGMKSEHLSMHMVFTGNPGTAKTSVARLFARILKENDILSKGRLIEVGRGDLVGKYVGWTADIVKKKFIEAKGGVLFIDEAYSLVDDRDGSFGDEAINTIVQEMENHRDDVVVIFAGYPDKMEKFLQKNPGLRSRIAYHISFDDYDAESLCKIAKLIAKQKGLRLTEEACDKLTDIFAHARTESDFGNGRYVRNVIEKAKMAQAARLLAMDYDSIKSTDIETIRAEDIEIPTTMKPERKQIGFCA